MPHRLLLPSTTLGSALLASVVLSACGGGGGTTTPDQALQTRAQASVSQNYTATYDVTGSAPATVTVYRTPTQLRLDVKTATGVATSIDTPSGVVTCEQPADGKAPTCLTVAAPGATPPAAFDPALRTVFDEDLRIFATPDNGLDVSTPTPTPTFVTPAGIQSPECFQIGGTPTPPVAVGTYCFGEEGIPVYLSFESGSAQLTKVVGGPPAPSVFVPITSPTPLPTK